MKVLFLIALLSGIPFTSVDAEDSIPSRHKYDLKAVTSFDKELLSTATALPIEQTLIQYDTGERGFTSFEQWRECLQGRINGETNLPAFCSPCEADGKPKVNVLISDFQDTCLPYGEDAKYVFGEKLSIEKRQLRDNLLCEAYQSRNCGVLGNMSFELGESDPAKLKALKNQVESKRQQSRKAVDSSDQSNSPNSVSSFISNERYLSAFSAISYSLDETEGAQLSGRLSSRNNLQIARQWTGASRGELDSKILTGNKLPESYCIDYAQFMQTQQLPKSNEFLDDLSRVRDFKPEDWNFEKLFKKFETLSKGNPNFEILIKTNPDAQTIYHRMAFLQRNPIMKSIFMAGGSLEQKKNLFQIIQKLPRTNCTGKACAQSEADKKALKIYREAMRGYLRDGDNIASAAAGVQELTEFERVRSLLRASRGATTVEVLDSPDKPAEKQRYRSDGGEWRRFCDVRSVVKSESSAVMEELESALGIGKRNPREPEKDEEFSKLNETACSQPRKNLSGTQMVFTDYLKGKCDGNCTASQRTQFFRSFVREFPESTSNDLPEISYLLLLGENEGVPAISAESVRSINQIAASSSVARSDVTYVPASGGASSVAQSAPSLATPASAVSSSTPRSTAENTSASPQAVSSGVFSDGNTFVSTPIVNPIPAALAQGESEAKQIRDEISSLREVMQQDSANEGPQNSQAVSDLSARLASLEQKLLAREKENNELRQQLAKAEETKSENAQVAEAASLPQTTKERRSLPATVQSAAAGESTASNPVLSQAPIGPAALSNSSAGRGATNLVRGRSSSTNAALLSKYGAQSNAAQGGIVVASQTELQKRSEGFIVPLPVPLAEYELLAGNNQEAIKPYLERCRSIADGELCRLSISAPGAATPLEIFVTKNGNALSVVPMSGVFRGIASENLPEPVKAPERDRTLDGLRRELGQ